MHKYQFEFRFLLLNIGFVLVGLGSFLFHGTLLYSMQMWDELPMVWTILTFLLILLHIESPKNKINKFVTVAFVLYGIFVSLLHVFSAFTTFFQIHFGILVGLAMVLEFWFAWKFNLKYFSTHILAPYVFFHAISIVCWMIDKHFCHWLSTELPFNPQFHAFWHLGSSLACYWGTLYIAALRGYVLNQSPSIRLWKHILPYVHISSAKNIYDPELRMNGFKPKKKVTTKRIRKSSTTTKKNE